MAIAQGPVLTAQAFELGLLASALGGLGQRRRVQGFEPFAAGQHQTDELLALLAASLGQRWQTPRRSPLTGTFLLDKRGEGLVERSVVLYIDPLVGQLMEDHRGQAFITPTKHRTEDRVVEPTQGRISLNATHIHIQPLLFLQRRRSSRRTLAVITAVGNAAGDGEAMGLRLK
ncbi:hypothetical protein D3C76_1227890 [compost metagenome]